MVDVREWKMTKWKEGEMRREPWPEKDGGTEEDEDEQNKPVSEKHEWKEGTTKKNYEQGTHITRRCIRPFEEEKNT